MHAVLAPFVLAFVGMTPAVQDDCEYAAERSAMVAATGATRVRIGAKAGSLRVEGRPDLTDVRVRGRACASDEELLAGIGVTADRSGGEVRVEVEVPEARSGFFRNAYARLDLVIEVPAGIGADIRDSSGEIEVRNTGAVEVQDGSGELTIEDVTGSVRIDDGSGEIMLFGIGGNVLLDRKSVV